MQVKQLLFVLSTSLFSLFSSAQLTGSVGPTTSVDTKRDIKNCNVLDYGAKADMKTDLGPALLAAFSACKTGGVVYVPPGDYVMSTWASLVGGHSWALQLDGIIYRLGTSNGHMIIIDGTQDFEFFSSNSKGAIQGYGYEFHSKGEYGPRLVRLQNVGNFSVHDMALVDSPQFHLIVDTCTNGEVYNVIVRGGNRGGLDGFDVSGTNIWVHDVAVTNKDECVTIKNPSTNILVENVHCNWSGGCAIGSLGGGTTISNIHYKNIYTQNSNNMLMIKSNGGSGYVEGLTLENFIGHSNAYSLLFDQAWAEEAVAAGDGVSVSNVVVKGWRGGEENGLQRGPIELKCANGAPCHNVTIDDFSMWTESGDSQIYICHNAFGQGGCIDPAVEFVEAVAYTPLSTTSTIRVAPTGYAAPTMTDDLYVGLGLTISIQIPAIPTMFYPGISAYSALLGDGGSDASSTRPTSTISTTITTPKTSSTSKVGITYISTPTFSFSRITTSAAIAPYSFTIYLTHPSESRKPTSSSSSSRATTSAVVTSYSFTLYPTHPSESRKLASPSSSLLLVTAYPSKTKSFTMSYISKPTMHTTHSSMIYSAKIPSSMVKFSHVTSISMSTTSLAFSSVTPASVPYHSGPHHSGPHHSGPHHSAPRDSVHSSGFHSTVTVTPAAAPFETHTSSIVHEVVLWTTVYMDGACEPFHTKASETMATY